MTYFAENFLDDTTLTTANGYACMQAWMQFFQSKSIQLEEQYFYHELNRLKNLQFDDTEVRNNVQALVIRVHDLKKSITRQEDLDRIASVLLLTHKYLCKNMDSLDKFQAELNQYGVVIEKHRTFHTLGYSIAIVLAAGAVILGLSLWQIAVLSAVAALVVRLTHRHAEDPYRIIGDQLATVLAGRDKQFDRVEKQRWDADELNSLLGV